MCPPCAMPFVPRFCPSCGNTTVAVPTSFSEPEGLPETQHVFRDYSNFPDGHYQPNMLSQSRSGSPTNPTLASKRPRSPSLIDGDQDTRRRKRLPDERVRIGKHAARTLRISFHADIVFRDGLKHLAASGWENTEAEKGIDDFEAGPFSNVGLFYELVKQIPGCIERLKDDDAHGSYRNEITTALERGANTARSDDCSGLKGSIFEMLGEYIQGKGKKTKVNRGFNDIALGRLLCPPQLDWDDTSVRAQLQNGDIRPSHTEYPPFLYEDFAIDTDRPLEGLFRSELLIKAARHIFIAPSATDNAEAASRSTRPGNAALNGMDSVTISTIAYVATMVRFALSSDDTFNIKNNNTGYKGGFQHWGFYKDIIIFLRDPKMEAKTKDLIEFWNSNLFKAAVNKRTGGEYSSSAKILAVL